MDTKNVLMGYITGFFDGEGAIWISEYTHVLTLQINNTDIGILKIFSGIFTGKVNEQKVYGNRKPQWTWRLNSGHTMNFLNTIKPYSIVKKKLVDLAIEYQNTKNRKSYRLSDTEIRNRERYINAMKELNDGLDINKIDEIKKLKIDDMLNGGSLFSKEELYQAYNINSGNIKEDTGISMPDDVFIGYCAGFFDGEGCVYISKRHTLFVFIDNTNFSVLSRIFNKFGGVIKERASHGTSKISWSLRMWSDDVLNFLMVIQPYSVVKRDQIELAIEYQTKVKSHSKHGKRVSTEEIEMRDMYRQKLVILKKQSGDNIEDDECDDINMCNKNQHILADY